MLRWKVHVLKKPHRVVSQNFTWSSQSFTLHDIKTSFKLPCVVKCCYETCPVDWGDFHFDLVQPLLLHSFRNVRKLCVRCVQKDENGQAKVFGPTLVIPEDYEGWFHMMQTDESRPTLHRTVESLVEASPLSTCYVASSLSYLALYGEPGENNELVADSRRMEAGEILETSHTVGTNTLKKTLKVKTENVPNEKCLICNDETGDKLILPLSSKGKFYVIADNSEGSNGLRDIPYIMSKKELFPIKIRHIIGELPAISSSYTSVLQCLDVIEEETILASTLDKMTMIPLELKMDSPFEFKMGLNDNQMRESKNYNAAVHMCATDGDSYVRGIKISFTISPTSVTTSASSIESESSIVSLRHLHISSMENESGACSSQPQPERTSYAETESLDSAPSICDTGSEIEEEDAQSEFMFEWTPPETAKRLSSKKKAAAKVTTIPPKVFNSSINTRNSPKSSMEEDMNVWNEQPDVV